MVADPEPLDRPYLVSEEEVELRVKALEALVLEKGLVSSDVLDRIAAHYEDEVDPRHGARDVARAWVDPEFKQRLLDDTTAACEELGVRGLLGEHLRAVENTCDVHNVVVCTLCSCYPWSLLGLPPSRHKSPEYRAKVVLEPRKTLAEDFGLTVASEVSVHVRDSNSELCYFVIPERPEHAEDMSEKELAGLVTRESMIGVGAVTTRERVLDVNAPGATRNVRGAVAVACLRHCRGVGRPRHCRPQCIRAGRRRSVALLAGDRAADVARPGSCVRPGARRRDVAPGRGCRRPGHPLTPCTGANDDEHLWR